MQCHSKLRQFLSRVTCKHTCTSNSDMSETDVEVTIGCSRSKGPLIDFLIGANITLEELGHLTS